MVIAVARLLAFLVATQTEAPKETIFPAVGWETSNRSENALCDLWVTAVGPNELRLDIRYPRHGRIYEGLSGGISNGWRDIVWQADDEGTLLQIWRKSALRTMSDGTHVVVSEGTRWRYKLDRTPFGAKLTIMNEADRTTLWVLYPLKDLIGNWTGLDGDKVIFVDFRSDDDAWSYEYSPREAEQRQRAMTSPQLPIQRARLWVSQGLLFSSDGRRWKYNVEAGRDFGSKTLTLIGRDAHGRKSRLKLGHSNPQ